MKTKVKVAISFVAGAAVGFTGSILYLRKKNAEYIDQVVKEIKDSYYKDLEELKKTVVVAEPKAEEKTEVVDEEPKAVLKKPNKAKTKVSELREATDEEEEQMDNIIKAQKYDYSAVSSSKKKSKPKVKGPQIITMEEYVNDRKHDKIILTYLDQESMFIDSEGEPVNDAEDFVGDLCKDIDYSQDNEAVYVRNDSIGVDYEIIIDITHTYKSYLEEEGNL